MTLPHLTIAYVTFRKEPHVEWFLDSIRQPPQTVSLGSSPHRILIIDFHHAIRSSEFRERIRIAGAIHTPPKPCVWQGKNRLPKSDHFAASNARNTALLLAPDGWIAYVDDLSVLSPAWLSRVHMAMAGDYIVLGAFKKVLGLLVEKGEVSGFRNHPLGEDSRWRWGDDNNAVSAAGSWLYGCSMAAPVEAFMQTNGWDEDCDSLGSEDTITGIMLGRTCWPFKYDRRMLTIESEEGHYSDIPMRRYDKGTRPNDKSHAILKMALSNRFTAPNYFGAGGIRAVRAVCLAGGPFPDLKVPQHDWYDGESLSNIP